MVFRALSSELTAEQTNSSGESIVICACGGGPAADTCRELKGVFAGLACVALLSGGRTHGALVVATRTQRAFSAQDVELLVSIGRQIGVAIEKADLMAKAQEAAAADERQRLARELHDAVTQTLFSASLIAEVLPRIWERNPEEARRRMEELRQLSRGALAEMRALLMELRPTSLVEAKFSDLLRQLSEAFTGRSRVPVELHVEGEYDLMPEVKVALYRIAQEALNNAAKHSCASHVWLSLKAADNRLELTVKDDGQGFDPGLVSPDHLGLGIMRERAQAIGAALTVESQEGSGALVRVVLQV